MKWIGLTTVALVLFAVITTTHFFHSSHEVRVGPFNASASPTIDRHVTFRAGAVLPSFRVSSPAVIGVEITVEQLQGGTLGQAVTSTAIVASSPKGEIDNVKTAMVSMLKRSAVFGALGTGIAILLAYLIFALVGPQRRQELRQAKPTRAVVVSGLALCVLVAAVPAVAVAGGADEEEWLPLSTVFTQFPLNDRWAQIEVQNSPLTVEVKNLVTGALNSYQESLRFYGELEERARLVEGLREPLDNERTALVVTDRHDNTPMDAVSRAIGDRVRAGVVLDLGDDTSTGGAWEKFSINSLTKTFDDYEAIVAVTGNHDSGSAVTEAMEEQGVTVLNGEVTTVAGLTVLGAPDPRSTEFGRGYREGEQAADDAIADVDQRLTATACSNTVSVVLIHAPAAARTLRESGCAPVILSGHLHRQVGPEVSEGEAGLTTSLTTGTTGGAAYAFALGSKLRRDAQVTLLTYDDGGKVLGLQVVTMTTGGDIVVQPYSPIAVIVPSVQRDTVG